MSLLIFNADVLGQSGSSGPTYSPTAPATPTAGMVWVDTSTMLTYEYYNTQWVQVPSATGPQGQAAASGVVLQKVQATYAVCTALTTVLPFDDTIPTNSEGTSVLSQAITLASSSNKVEIAVSLPMIAIVTGGAWLCYAIFRDSVCIDSGASCFAWANYGISLQLTITDTPATTSPTYSVRIGPAVTGTGYINGTAAARYFGSTCISTLTLSEIKV